MKAALCTAIALLLACGPAAATDWAKPGAVAPATGPGSLDNATVSGIFDLPITLEEGQWQGDPYVPGGASRPTAGLVPDVPVTGALSREGNTLPVAILWASMGGSGNFRHLVVFNREAAGVRSIATALIGDRAEIRSITITGTTIELRVIQAGSDDPLCCPQTKVLRSWTLSGDRLLEQAPVVLGRIALSDLDGTTWQLLQEGPEDTAIGDSIMLRTDGEKLSGTAQCNRYQGSIRAGIASGSLTIGPLASTRKLCEDAVMQREQEFLARLGAVTRFRFDNARLVLSGAPDTDPFILRFVPAPDR